MKIAIMQPYFFPYIGYFSLLKATDKFVIFDTPQYDRKGWMNRNRILNLNAKDTFINIPTRKMPLGTPINEIIINNDQDWKLKLLNQLEIYKRAPYYNETLKVIKEILNLDQVYLSDFNKNSLIIISKYLGLLCEISVFSELHLEISNVSEADEWALNISKALNATQYFNPPGGLDFFDKNKYSEANIELNFLKHNLPEYKQFNSKFIPGLSIIDVMMFNNKETINKMLEDYEVL